MPSVDVAMARSLRPAAWKLVRDAIVRSVAESSTKRDIVSDTQSKITDVKTAFSSWDNCMKASFCKWPVIAVIIVGSLIIVSVVWCIIRCCCCGLSCCCSCFQCFKCCGNCCGCCDSPGDRKHKYLDEPYIPSHHGQSQGYRNQAPMQTHFSPSAPAKFEQQYAEFDVSKRGDGDALPPMPSWEHSGSKKVLVEEEEVEMSNLKKTPSPLNHNRMNPPSPGPVSPMSINHDRPYGNIPGSSSGHTNHSQQDLLLSPQSPGYGQPNQGPYGAQNHGYNNNNFNTNRHSTGFGLNDPYDDHAPMSGANGYGHAGQQFQPYEAPGHQPYDNVPYGAAAAAAGGAAGVAGAMVMHNQSTGLHDQPYGASPVVGGAAFGPGGSQSPAPAQGHPPYGLYEIHEQYAEMPAIPVDHDSVHNSALAQQNRSQLPDQTAPRELAGSTPPEAHGLRRPSTGDKNASSPVVGGRLPYGMESSMRNSPGPNPASPPSNTFDQSSPRPPFANNSGFDFDSGLSRQQEDQHYSPPAQAPTTAAYPGQRTYQAR